jgi:AraC-like DNA-binding protein
MDMAGKRSGSGGAGLERSCDDLSRDWIRQTEPADGVELLEAWFHGPAYRKHRHDTYAIALTNRGVQAFDYRGAGYISLPGDVVVLHPDELHDGNAGSEAGFGYRLLYVEPSLIFAAVRTLAGHRAALPFVRQPVMRNPTLREAIQVAFADDREPLATDDLVLLLAEGLLEADNSQARAPVPHHLDLVAVERARQFLDAEKTRVVRSWELEEISGLNRYDLARQFRAVVGTSPYRYALMRRLFAARGQLSPQRSLAEVAFTAGFADQSHFTRMFTAAFGITPARYAALRGGRRTEDGGRKWETAG